MSPWQQPVCVCVCVCVWCDGMKWRVCLTSLRGPQLESLSHPNILFIPGSNYWHDLVCITYCKWAPCSFISLTSHNQPTRSSCDWWRSWNSEITPVLGTPSPIRKPHVQNPFQCKSWACSTRLCAAFQTGALSFSRGNQALGCSALVTPSGCRTSRKQPSI